MRFAYDIYNAKRVSGNGPALAYSYTLYREGKPVFTSVRHPLADAPVDAHGVVSATGAIKLGADLVPGDHVLKIDVFDTSKPNTVRKATQFVEFEVVPEPPGKSQ